jgi:hypothetical protein
MITRALCRRARRFPLSPTGRARGLRFLPRLEAVEDRTLPATFTWSGAASALWSDPANWQQGAVPGAADTAVFDDTATHFAATLDPAAPGAVAGLLISWTAPGATLTLGQPLNAGQLQMNHGTIDGPFGLTAAGGTWSGGTVSTTTFDVAPGNLLTITGTDPKTLDTTFENFGTTRWTGGDVRNTASSTIVHNEPNAVFEADNHAQWLQDGTGTGFFNEGVFRKVNDAGTTTFNIAFYGLKTGSADVEVGTLRLTDNGKHTGPVFIAAGAEILCEGGYLLDGVTVTGPGFFHIAATDQQVLVANGVHVDNLLMDGGTLGYIGAMFVQQNFLWNGGTLVGKTEVAAGGSMTVAGAAPKAVKYGAALNNLGTTVWQDSAPIDLDGVWTNFPRANFEVQGGGVISSLGNGSFVNEGTFRKTGGGATTLQTLFANTGTLEGLAGSITLYRGSSGPGDQGITIGPGATIDLVDFTLDGTTETGAGLLRFTGAGVVTILDDVTAANVEQTDSLLTTNAGNLHVTGTMTWVKGFISGSTQNFVEIKPAATLAIVGPDGRVLSGNITNFGTAVWTGTGTITVTNGRAFTNQAGALFDAQSNAAFTSAGTFRNEGLLRREIDPGTTRFDVTLVNTGKIEIQRGTISLGKAFSNAGAMILSPGCAFTTDQSYTQTAGGSVVLQSATLSAKTGFTILVGPVSGTGVIKGNVVNAGAIAPGGRNGIGTLQVIGNYSQAPTGILKLEIGGPGPGTGYDQLQITGTATLGGTLAVTLANGYQPQPDDSFVVGTFASHSGTFTSVTGDGPLFDVAYNSTNVTLVAKGPGPAGGQNASRLRSTGPPLSRLGVSRNRAHARHRPEAL